jgi:hypothetical protein
MSGITTSIPEIFDSGFALLNEALLPVAVAPAADLVPKVAKSKKEAALKKEPKPRRELTEHEKIIIPLLWEQVTYTPASFDKRFAREIQRVQQITEGQSGQVWRLFKRYRRQIKHPEKDKLLVLAEQWAAPELRGKS